MAYAPDHGNAVPDMPMPADGCATVPAAWLLQFVSNQQELVRLQAENEALRAANKALKEENEELKGGRCSGNRHTELLQLIDPEKMERVQPLLNRLELYLANKKQLPDQYVFDVKRFSRRDIFAIFHELIPFLFVKQKVLHEFIIKRTNLNDNENTVKSNLYALNKKD